MNPISHKQAQDWFQHRLDGVLDERQAAILENHLKACIPCQEYAAKFEQLDLTLRQGYRARAQARQFAVSQSALPDSANHWLQRQMRLKMKSKQMLNFTTSAAFMAAMVILAIGFAWLISIQNRVTLPGLPALPAPTATATPFPWTKEAPLTDADQITAILNDLAEKNVAAFQQAEWVHTVRKDPGQPGTVPTTDSESWFQYPKGDQTCITGMEVVAQELGSAPLQILVSRADGPYGDLVQLRKGNGEVTHRKPGDYGCSLKPEFIYTGELAAKIKAEQAASAEKMDVKAWYETVQGRSEFIVAATFKALSKANATGIVKETHGFEIENGLATQASMRAERVDGALFAESAQVHLTEFVAALPPDVAEQWKEFSGELQTYVNGVNEPLATVTDVTGSSPVIVVEDQQYISPNKPLTDGQTILQILEALERLQIRRLSQPGWYVYGPKNISAEDWMANRYMLVQTIDITGACNYMSYYVKAGKTLPQEIVLADGRWGMIGPVENGQMKAGEKGQINWSNGPMSETCQVPNVETVSYLRNETQFFKDIVDGTTKGTYKGWTEQIRGRKFFVLYINIENNGFGTVMDPGTGKLEPINQQESWLYFDLNWGAVIEEASVQVFHLQNGKTIGSAPAADKAIDADYTFYKKLPTDLQAVFDKTVTDLAALYP